MVGFQAIPCVLCRGFHGVGHAFVPLFPTLGPGKNADENLVDSDIFTEELYNTLKIIFKDLSSIAFKIPPINTPSSHLGDSSSRVSIPEVLHAACPGRRIRNELKLGPSNAYACQTVSYQPHALSRRWNFNGGAQPTFSIRVWPDSNCATKPSRTASPRSTLRLTCRLPSRFC